MKELKKLELIDKLSETKSLERNEIKELLTNGGEYLLEKAREERFKVYENQIFVRGLIEFTSFCKNDCYYCGLRCGNASAERYRLDKSEILKCCRTGYDIGFRTFVLQGGEDPYYTDSILCDIVCGIREKYPDCAITLSVGERSAASYRNLFDAGVERYLLRHETACNSHYEKLHPKSMSLESRKKCLWNLKEIGFYVGCGFMVGSPGQTLDNIVDDILFIKELEPSMVGVGPFIPHSKTPFRHEKAGGLNLTLNCLAVLRLMQPGLLIPATTALETLAPHGRRMGVLAGANVLMLNISPVNMQKKYMLYNNKLCMEKEASVSKDYIQKQMQDIGCEIVVSRGDPVAV